MSCFKERVLRSVNYHISDSFLRVLGVNY